MFVSFGSYDFRQKHDPNKPHWHLNAIGALPERQGQGIRSLLLSHLCYRKKDLGIPHRFEISQILLMSSETSPPLICSSPLSSLSSIHRGDLQNHKQLYGLYPIDFIIIDQDLERKKRLQEWRLRPLHQPSRQTCPDLSGSAESPKRF